MRLVVRRGWRYRTTGAGIQQTPGYRSRVSGGVLDRVLGRSVGGWKGGVLGGVLGWLGERVGSMERCGEGCWEEGWEVWLVLSRGPGEEERGGGQEAELAGHLCRAGRRLDSDWRGDRLPGSSTRLKHR